MRLQGLLQLLWLEAGLADWYPKMEDKRTPERVAYWVSEAAKRIRASRMSVHDVLLVPADKDSAGAKRNAAVGHCGTDVLQQCYRGAQVQAASVPG